jgi:hypothetical protein
MTYIASSKKLKVPKFVITDYHRRKARSLGISINYSKSPGKKLDVFKDDKKVASIGASDYWDFISYLKAEQEGKFRKGYAEERRRLYKIRHKKNNKPGTPGYYALNILW